MICSKCGNSIPKDDEYCPKCGHKITAEEHSFDTGVVKNSTLELLRSAMFRTICWCFVGFIACMIIGWFIPLNLENYAEGLRKIGAPENIANIFDISDSSGKLQLVKILLLFIVSLPILLSTIGLIILKAHANGNSEQTGLDMVKVGIRVGIIYFSMIALGCVGGGVVLIVFGGYGDRTSLSWTIPAFLFIMAFVVAALMLLVKMMTFAQVIKEAVTNDDFTEKPSLFVQVTSVILGVVGMVISTVILVLAFDVLTASALVCWSLAQIFIGMMIGKVRVIDNRFYGGLYDTIYKGSSTPGSGRLFCTRCGRELMGGEMCTCIPRRYVSSDFAYDGERRLISSMRTTAESSTGSASVSHGGKYFKKAKKL